MSATIEVKLQETARDGLPDMAKLTGRVAFVFDGCIVSGWPVGDGERWQGNSDVAVNSWFADVTHWLEFPVLVWDLPDVRHDDDRYKPFQPWLTEPHA